MATLLKSAGNVFGAAVLYSTLLLASTKIALNAGFTLLTLSVVQVAAVGAVNLVKDTATLSDWVAVTALSVGLSAVTVVAVAFQSVAALPNCT